jgi:hypothetical protein
MSQTLARRVIAALIPGLAALAVAVPAAANHSWGGYHWARTANPFTLKVGNNMTTAEWRSYLAQTSQDWNGGKTPLLTAVVPGSSSTKRCAMVAGTTQVCNNRYGNNGWLGLASINVTGGVHITQGTAKMNDTYFDSAYYNNPNEKLHVVCQEVAHTFGLAHQSEDGSSQNSCMDYFSNTGANARSTLSTKPNQHDFDMLKSIYAHLDSTSTLAAMTPITSALGRGNDISDDARSWGMLMSQSANGRSSTYERDNADGSKTITHVFWTREAAALCPSCDHRFDH